MVVQQAVPVLLTLEVLRGTKLSIEAGEWWYSRQFQCYCLMSGETRNFFCQIIIAQDSNAYYLELHLTHAQLGMLSLQACHAATAIVTFVFSKQFG